MTPQQPGHAGGWSWRKQHAGHIPHPWAWSQINGGEDLPQHTNGLCEHGWHTDCPQAPGPANGEPGTCGCPCHQTQLTLPIGAA